MHLQRWKAALQNLGAIINTRSVAASAAVDAAAEAPASADDNSSEGSSSSDEESSSDDDASPMDAFMFQPRTDAVAAPSATAADAGNGGGSFEEQEAALSAEEAATLRADRAQCMEWINEHALYDAALATFPDHVNRSMRRMVLLAYGRHLVQERCTNDALLAFSLAAPQDVYVTPPRRRATLHQGCSHRSPVCYWSSPLLSFPSAMVSWLPLVPQETGELCCTWPKAWQSCRPMTSSSLPTSWRRHHHCATRQTQRSCWYANSPCQQTTVLPD